MSSFVVAPLIQKLPKQPRSIIRFLPSVWFLSLCETVRHASPPVFHHLANTGLFAVAAASILAVVTYTLSFRRCFLSIPEMIETAGPRTGSGLLLLLRVANRFYLPTPARRACFAFVLRTLARSEKHFTALGAFVGMGLLLSAQTMLTATRDGAETTSGVPARALLSIPLIVIYCFVIGLRLVFEIPVDLRANWIFKLQLDPTAGDGVALGRALAWTFLAPSLLVICFPAYLYSWGWQVAALHSLFLTAITALLVETLMLRLRKIPFTCSLPVFREHAFVVVFILIVGFYLFVRAATFLEYLAFVSPLRIILILIALGSWWMVLRQYQANIIDLDKSLIFEETPVEAVQLLGLE
jgi:hypothetical protein